jgi:hypothetical protein
VYIALASEFGLKLLSNSQYVIINFTFNVSEYKLYLTIIMGYKDDITLSATYLLSNLQNTHNYKSFYRVRERIDV